MMNTVEELFISYKRPVFWMIGIGHVVCCVWKTCNYVCQFFAQRSEQRIEESIPGPTAPSQQQNVSEVAVQAGSSQETAVQAASSQETDEETSLLLRSDTLEFMLEQLEEWCLAHIGEPKDFDQFSKMKQDALIIRDAILKQHDVLKNRPVDIPWKQGTMKLDFKDELSQLLRDDLRDIRAELGMELAELKKNFSAYWKDWETQLESKTNERFQETESKLRKELEEVRFSKLQHLKGLGKSMVDGEGDSLPRLGKSQIKRFGAMHASFPYLDCRIKNRENGYHMKPFTQTWEIDGFAQKLQGLWEKTEEVVSKDFYIANRILFRPSLITCNGTKVILIKISITDERRLKDVCSFPFLHARRYILLDQSGEEPRDDIEVCDWPSFRESRAEDMVKKTFGLPMLCTLEMLQVKNKYVKDDKIKIEIMLEPIRYLARKVAFTNGHFDWKIDGYFKKKQSEMDGTHLWSTSEPFSVDGYLMRVEMSMNGKGVEKEGFNSLFLQVLLGEDDYSLPFPFKCGITFSLMDRSGAGEHVTNTQVVVFNERNLNLRIPEFVKQEMTEKSKFLIDDSIVIRTEVKVLKLDKTDEDEAKDEVKDSAYFLTLD